MRFLPIFGKGHAKKIDEIASRGTIEIGGVLVGKMRALDLLSSISAISNPEIEGECVSAMIVESTDRSKKPYLFIKLILTKSQAIAEYSVTKEIVNPNMRRLTVMGTFFNILSVLECEGAFRSSASCMYISTSEAIRTASSFIGSEPLKLKYNLDLCRHENAKLKEENDGLKEEKEGLGFQCMEMERRLDSALDRVSSLEGMTDNELDSEILRWVDEHGGKLHEEGFCRAHAIRSTRLEERLEALSKSGVIRFV